MRAASLWRNPGFRKLWAGQAISEVGSRVSREGIPWTALLVLQATPVQMGWLAALSGFSALAAGPLAGSLADRYRRRPLMIAADVGRALALAAVPYSALTGQLSIPLLFAVAVVSGALSVLFDVAYPSYVPGLVPQGRLLEANSKLALTSGVAEVTGPGLTGLLVQALTAPIAILIDAVSFLVSAASLAWIRAPEPLPATRVHERSRSHWMTGFRFVACHPVLRPLALRTVTAAFCFGIPSALYVLYASRELGMGAALLGFIIALGGASNLAGALLAEPLGRRFAPRSVVIGATLWSGVWFLPVALAPGPGWIAMLCLTASQLIGDLAYPIYSIHELTIRQQAAPPELLGRVNAVTQVLFRAAFPLGALAGGWLAGQAGARGTLAGAAIGILASTLWLLAIPSLTKRRPEL